jgi:glycosyltransferase involved in cell wall biosynthesis
MTPHTPPTTPPLVSVIVPAYNYGHLIGETLESLRAQSYTRWECVVCDDGSTDDTPSVVARLAERDARIRYVRQENRWQAAAKNTAVKESGGAYLQFLDADDLIEPEKFEKQVAYLERRAEVDIVYGDVRFFPTERPAERLYTMWGENKPWQPGISGRGRDVLLPLLRFNSIIINAPLVRRGVVERVGLFDEELFLNEDWEFWVRCALAGVRFQFEDDAGTLALVRSHPVSSSKNNLRVARAAVLMRRKLRALLKGDARRAYAELLAEAEAAPERLLEEAARANDELLAEAEGTLGAEEVMHGSRLQGVRQLGRAALLDRRWKHRLKWLSCALVAPLVSRERFGKVYAASITNAVAGPLRRLRANRRR